MNAWYAGQGMGAKWEDNERAETEDVSYSLLITEGYAYGYAYVYAMRRRIRSLIEGALNFTLVC